MDGIHILITTGGYLQQRCIDRRKPDFSAVKMVVYDEADELFIQDVNCSHFQALYKEFAQQKVTPQHLLFSATFNDNIIARLKEQIGSFELFPLKKEALKLKGVKNFKITLDTNLKI